MKRRRKAVREQPSLLAGLFPESSKVLLTGGGKQFVERLGVEVVKEVILSVMMGENLRTRTEPLSRRRIAQVSGAVIKLFADGYRRPEFRKSISEAAIEDLGRARRNDNARIWPAQWLIGLTGKSVQNVLRSDPEAFAQYVADFEAACAGAALQCARDFGEMRMTLASEGERTSEPVNLDWYDITRLTTAIGSQTLTIRGSDKSMYGKLFERLILGSFLSIMGFERVDPAQNTRTEGVFWLSDSSDDREADATLLVSPGSLARFDIGFIGPGNSEISKDKLSRFARQMEVAGKRSNAVTFVVVDRLPETSKTIAAAKRIGAEIVQMSMQFWPRTLAQKLGARLGIEHDLQTLPDGEMHSYLEARLARIAVADFLSGLTVDDLQTGDVGP